MSAVALPYSDEAWNQAHARVLRFLESFALADRPHTARLALRFLDLARERHAADPSRDPTTLALELARQALAGWLAESLGTERSLSETVAAGHLALLLSGVPRNAPAAFLTSPISDEVRQSLRRTLLVVGPDLTLSSMTPRHLDYGPMMNLANQTWHRWDVREVVAAFLFWAAVYVVLYQWLSDWV